MRRQASASPRMLGNLNAATAVRFLGPLMPDPRCGWRAAWMGYVIFGAGAIGAVVDSCLFQAGFEVTLIARGVHLQALQPNGCDLSHRRTPKRSALRRWAIHVRSVSEGRLGNRRRIPSCEGLWREAGPRQCGTRW